MIRILSHRAHRGAHLAQFATLLLCATLLLGLAVPAHAEDKDFTATVTGRSVGEADVTTAARSPSPKPGPACVTAGSASTT